YPLVEGQGNFGSIDGDAPAAYRYTEARLSKIAEELLADIEKKTVRFVPNFDQSAEEPVVLPAKLPSLLVNGSSGIAVGMATNIPPHNLAEICDGLCALATNPELTTAELMTFVKGPDFPTGGLIIGKEGLIEAYSTGKGKVIVRARTHIEEVKGRTKIIVTEIPFMKSKAAIIEEIATLVNERRISGISDIRDESDRSGIRVVIELKPGTNPEVLLNQLFATTGLQDTFSIILLGLVENEPKICTLKQLMQLFIAHRKEVVRNRVKFELAEASSKAHILEGLLIALSRIDEIISLLKSSRNTDSAKKALIERYSLSEQQAQAVLDTKLQRLTSLEQEKIKSEHSNLLQEIAKLKDILGSEQKIIAIIKDELAELKAKYSDARRTQILEAAQPLLEAESLIKPEEVVVTVSHAGYIKRLPLETYKTQRRGGKGIVAAGKKEEDFIERLFVANNLDTILLFTNIGKCHWLKVWQIPEASRQARGTPIVNLVELSEGEKVNTVLPLKDFEPSKYLFLATKEGIVKRTPLSEFSNPRKGGILSIKLRESDRLVSAMLTNGSDEILIATTNGLVIRFDENEVRPMGRDAQGVIGIKLRAGDSVISAVVAEPGKDLLTVTENGFGKRTSLEEYRRTSRGGVGVINIKVMKKNGQVVGAAIVSENDELMLVTKEGVGLRTAVSQLARKGRATQGIRLMKLAPGDRLVSIAKIVPENGD
ncbi:MAG: DNA gyrase subunit A, partial [Candidatus Woesearchaeota archaeon]